MNKLKLSDLIKKTQIAQKQDLQKFENYINQSVILKKSASGYKNDDENIIEQILKNFSDGVISNIPINENSTLLDMLSILLQNQDYIEKLSDIIFIEAKTSDERLELLVTYLEAHIKQNIKVP